MNRDVQVPDPFPVEPVGQVRWVSPWPVVVLPMAQATVPCMFDAYMQRLSPTERAKPQVLLLSCPCPRCTPWCLSI